MSFDQNMIIDATTGSIARFVNHSCSPNCHMIKWIVSGQPRMALFAGDRPIMTGEELTYDYNFDPFSAKNVQKCLCGSPNCRGVLGPRPKEIKPAKPDLTKTVKARVKAGKRNIQELIGDKEDGSAAKKRKIKAATGPSAKPVKRSVSSASLKAAKKAAKKVVRKTISTISVNTKGTKGTKGGAKGAATPASSKKVTTVKRKSTVVKTYSKGKPAAAAARQSTSPKSPKKSLSRKSSLTIVAASGNENQDLEEGVAAAKKMALAAAGQEKPTPTRNSPRKSAAAAAVASPTARKGLDLNRVSPKIRLVQSPSKTAA